MRKNIIVHRIFSFVIAFLLVAMISLVAFLFMFGRYIRDFFEEFLSIQLDFITAFENVRWIGAFLIISVIMTVIYYVVPNVRWSFKYSVPGAAFATVGFLLISQLFSFYVGVAGSQAIGNGAIGVVITLLLWLYLMGDSADTGRLPQRDAVPLFPAIADCPEGREPLCDPLFEERIGVDRQRTVAETASDPQKTCASKRTNKLTYD